MDRDSATAWTKGVSRSFYLSIRLLPAAMRPATALAYLLARTSDTLADSATAEPAERLSALDAFAAAVAGSGRAPSWPPALTAGVKDPRERELLTRTVAVLAGVESLPAGQARLVREVVATIIGGQRLDLERFAPATAEHPVALPDEEALLDYAWRVAGCVGEFWTKLGFLALGDGFSNAGEDTLLPLARNFGTSLQLVNILRDMPADLATGRCYLPVADPTNRDALMAAHQLWVDRASDGVADGHHYAACLTLRRLRAASALPAMLADDTLRLLAGISWPALAARPKVPRRRVYQLVVRALLR
ncbi:MAG: squalene/phytoene synthase family protein [Akkermansiaceae bacterium]|jgi:farnesyl-diphosphate farnesyltransferase|nr:squalene/phytoene synthase family protein [Akkermansiaceae bacterium]